MIVSVGDRLGQYILVEKIGQGGYADVFEARDRFLGRRVAIKVLRSKRFTRENVHTFLAEAQMLSRLKHLHIVEVIEFNIENHIPYLVMELATGGTLRKRHPLGKQLSLEIILGYLQQIVEALDFIHHFEGGLVHLDVKPENMLIMEDGRVVLNDFGIATFLKTRLAGKKECVGTIHYMAPECFRGRASAASDQYALAVVVYSWLTGMYPFDGTALVDDYPYDSTWSRIARQHMYAPPPAIRCARPDVSIAVEQVVLQAMAKDPRDRFESVTEFVASLDAAWAVSQLPNQGFTNKFDQFIHALIGFISRSQRF